VIRGLLNIGVERSRFPVDIREVRPGDRLSRDEYDILVYETDHRADTVGFALVEHERLGRFNPERARELGIPEGPLWGKIHRGESVTTPEGRVVAADELVGPTRPGRKLVYPGDTRPSPRVIEMAHGADLFIHEATFTEDERDRAHETGHSTARQAAEMARMAAVRKLVLTHISARYSREAPEVLEEAKDVFSETIIARDGLTVEVPFVT
jgi:ribonuclease Z